MARDRYIALDRCAYCGRPGFTAWDVDLFSCSNELCEALAYGEVKRRTQRGDGDPQRKLERALVATLTTFEHALRLDVDAELLPHREAKRIDEHEREETARVIGKLHALAHRR